MIDPVIRSQGIGGSEIAAICGLDDRRDAFSVYADKLGLLQRAAPSKRMRWGKLLERAIVTGYGEETGLSVAWHDETVVNRSRAWQVSTPDAFAWSSDDLSFNPATRVGGVDAKNVSFDQMQKWGDAGSNIVPDTIALQCQWYCSAEELPWWDVAALFGGNDLRIYRIHRDRGIEEILLSAAEAFWRDHVLARVPPPIGCSQAAADYLKKWFPKNVQALRHADAVELGMLAQLKQAKEEFKEAEAAKDALENQTKLLIGDHDGLILPAKGKVTWTKDRDSMGPNWEVIARELALQRGLLMSGERAPEDWMPLDQMIAANQVITRNGPRVLRCTWPKADDAWIPKELPAREPVLLES